MGHAGYFNAGGLRRRGIPAGRVSCGTRTPALQADKEPLSCMAAELCSTPRPPDPPVETRAAACRRVSPVHPETACVSAELLQSAKVLGQQFDLKISEHKSKTDLRSVVKRAGKMPRR